MTKINFTSGGKIISRLAISATLATTVAAAGMMCACTSQNSPAQGNTNVPSFNVADKQGNSASNTSADVAISEDFSLKGAIDGVQHIRHGKNDFLMISLMLEPNLEDQSQMEESKWEADILFVAKDDAGNVLGSWKSDTISYTWTFGERIDDNSKHTSVHNDLEGATTLEAYLAWAKGTFPDGSAVEIGKKDLDDAQAIMKDCPFIGEQQIETAKISPL